METLHDNRTPARRTLEDFPRGEDYPGIIVVCPPPPPLLRYMSVLSLLRLLNVRNFKMAAVRRCARPARGHHASRRRQIHSDQSRSRFHAAHLESATAAPERPRPRRRTAASAIFNLLTLSLPRRTLARRVDGRKTGSNRGPINQHYFHISPAARRSLSAEWVRSGP